MDDFDKGMLRKAIEAYIKDYENPREATENLELHVQYLAYKFKELKEKRSGMKDSVNWVKDMNIRKGVR